MARPRVTGTGATPAAAGRPRDREVLDAATRVFYERGYADATVQDIASALGILKGSLYYYIDTKEDLLFRVLSEVQERTGEIRDDVEARTDLEAIERLRLYVERQLEFTVSHLLPISVYHHDADQLSGARRAAIVAARREQEAFVAGLIAEAQRQGQAVRRHDPHVLAKLVFGVIIWPYRWYRADGPVDGETLSRLCAEFALGGLAGDG